MYQKMSAAVLAAMIKERTGWGKLVFSGNPEVTLGKATGLPLETGVEGNLPVQHLDYGRNASELTFWSGEGKWLHPFPIGSIHWFPSTLAPAGYLPLKGEEVSRETFSELWEFAQKPENKEQFTEGDGSLTFGLPNYSPGEGFPTPYIYCGVSNSQ